MRRQRTILTRVQDLLTLLEAVEQSVTAAAAAAQAERCSRHKHQAKRNISSAAHKYGRQSSLRKSILHMNGEEEDGGSVGSKPALRSVKTYPSRVRAPAPGLKACDRPLL
ncbi:hypothetical protein PoB_003791900 [Plakobranchus ocellatus]|uniref:Uncharacterized protein n=1 Tax=Plakobranchus ocellatus TaxID=259542 RepID=A0AAV4AZ77_9GAST|nr:hypothetical protein PoB_003791900 [Plakobranchus ocellatus]